jgi:hypothetical protein
VNTFSPLALWHAGQFVIRVCQQMGIDLLSLPNIHAIANRYCSPELAKLLLEHRQLFNQSVNVDGFPAFPLEELQRGARNHIV